MEDADLYVVRSWCGSTIGTDDSKYPEADLDDRLERLGTANLVALEVLRERRADFLADPLSLNLQGDLSYTAVKNVEALDSQIASLERACGVTSTSVPTVTLGQISRADDIGR